MKIKSTDNLQNFLNSELKERKREISTLYFSFCKARTHEKPAFAKSLLVILYSHWEGFVKSSSQAFIEYLNHNGYKYSQLKDCFVQIGLAKELPNHKLSTYSHRQTVIDFLTTGIEGSFKVNSEKIIDTKSNLSSEVLKELLLNLGLNYQTFELKENFIDKVLLSNRNKIAHGDNSIDITDLTSNVSSYKISVIEMLDSYKSQIEDAVMCRSYLRQ